MFSYRIINEDQVEITGFVGTDVNLTIPEKIEGRTVTSIGISAFERMPIESIMLPASITTVGDYAFRFSKLWSINLENLCTIGVEAFRGTKLIDISLSRVVSLGDGAFHHCHRLYSITLSNTVKLNLDNHFSGLHIREIHYLGSKMEFLRSIEGSLENDHPVFYYLNEDGEEYKEILGRGEKSQFEYTIFADGIRIDKAYGTMVIVPEEIDGVYVTSIDDFAFDPFVKEAFIPSTVREAKDCFGSCVVLQRISIPFDLFIDPSTLPQNTVVERRSD